MSGDSIELRNAARITAPYASMISSLAVAVTASSQDLSLCGPQTTDLSEALSDIFSPTMRSPGGLVGRYVRFTFTSSTAGATCGLLFGATQAAVTTTNAPVLATNGVNTAGVCEQLVAGTYVDLWVSVNTRWVGFIGSAVGQLCVRASSRGDQG